MISARSKRFNNCFLHLYYVCIQLAGVMQAGLMLSTFLVENQRHKVALHMYYRVSTARCVFFNMSFFTEIFLKRIKGKRTGKDCFCVDKQGLIHKQVEFKLKM